MKTVTVRSGLGPRKIVDFSDGDAHTPTLQFPRPVFDRDPDWIELEARGMLGARFQEHDVCAAARARMVGEYMTGAVRAAMPWSIRSLLDAFDMQNEEELRLRAAEFKRRHPERCVQVTP